MTKQLYELIQCLNKAEKRHFKIYTAGMAENAHYKRIFDAYENATEFSESTIIEKNNLELSSSYRVTKIYLEAKVLECLRNLHENTILGVERVAENHLANAKVCLEKGILLLAEEHIDKCIGICRNYELNELLKKALCAKIDFLQTFHLVQWNTIVDLRQEMQNVTPIMAICEELYHINVSLDYFYKTQNQAGAQVINSIQQNLQKIELENLNFTAKNLYLQVHLKLALFKHDNKQALNIALKLVEWWQNNPDFIREKYPDFLNIQKLSILLAIQQGNISDISEKIQQINLVCEAHIPQTNAYITWRLQTQNTTALLQIALAKQLQQHQTMLSLCEGLLHKYQHEALWKFFMQKYGLEIVLNIAYCWFQMKDYMLIISHLKPYYDHKLKTIADYQQKVAIAVMYLIACFETNNQITKSSDNEINKVSKWLDNPAKATYPYLCMLALKLLYGKQFTKTSAAILNVCAKDLASLEAQQVWYFQMSYWVTTKIKISTNEQAQKHNIKNIVITTTS
ncbi:MAG: hypothetical protein JNM36_00375 [Chitinophagales bacterium]|jgi:hypothetical protein|nr:hypothetical protein [Chitinophagales bacterium]